MECAPVVSSDELLAKNFRQLQELANNTRLQRQSMADFEKRLRAAVSGPPLAHWVIDGVFWVLGAGLLAAWASGLVWVVTHFDLL